MSAPLERGAGTTALDDPQHPATARGRLLKAAADLFCRYGINATGVDAVVESAGTAKATLYKIFGSKEGLVEAVLDEEGAAWRQWFIGRIDDTPGNARDKLVGMFDALGDWFAQERFFGCPFINAVGEFDKKDTRYKDIALAHKGVVMRHITALAAEAGCADAETTAHQLGLLIDGAIVAALITGDARIARYGRDAAENILVCNASH
jgi:AcrR family transcriptional regulator